MESTGDGSSMPINDQVPEERKIPCRPGSKGTATTAEAVSWVAGV